MIRIATVALCLMPSVVLAQRAPNPAPVHFTVDTISANVHVSPSVGSAVVGKVLRGRTLEVTRELGDWVKVTWPESPDGFAYMHVTVGRIVRGGMARQTEPSGVPASKPGTSRSPWPQSPAPRQPSPEQAVASQVRGPVYVAPPSHFVGVGGLMSGSTLGFGVTGRAWSRGPLGGQIDVSRIAQSNASLPQRMTSLEFSPSVLYGFTDFVTDYVWVRPYVGAGWSLNRHTMSGVTPEDSVTRNKFSFQGFGGVEMTMANIPRFAVSIDAGYDSAKSPFDGFESGGFGFSISGRWYFK